MAGQPRVPPKAAAFGVLLVVYVGGAYQAWRALAVERHPLPDPAQLQQPAGNATATAAAAVASVAAALCGSPPALHCTLMPGDAAAQLPDLPAMADAHLQPALARLTGSRAAVVTTSTLLHPPPLPAARWNERRVAWVLPSAAAAAWLHQLQRAAWAAAAGGLGSREGAARVLLYVPPPDRQPLLLELGPAPGGSGSAREVGPAGGGSGAAARGSVELADGSLLVVVDTSAGGGSSSDGQAALGPLAQRILAWLLHPLASSSSSSSSSSSDAGGSALNELQQALATTCAAGARAALQQAAAVAAAAPGQPVTAAMSRRAAEAAQLLRAASRSSSNGSEAAAALAAARAAWAAARHVASDPASGAHPAFPPEHSLAVLLPLALPVTLVLAQAAGRELAAWKQRRRGQRPSFGAAAVGAGPAAEAAGGTAGGPERSRAE